MCVRIKIGQNERRCPQGHEPCDSDLTERQARWTHFIRIITLKPIAVLNRQLHSLTFDPNLHSAVPVNRGFDPSLQPKIIFARISPQRLKPVFTGDLYGTTEVMP